MKKIFLFILVLASLKASAQESKKPFEQDVNYLGCRITAYTLQGTVQTEFKKKFSCDTISGVNEINEYLRENNQDVNIQLLGEIEQLNKFFKPAWKPDRIISFLTKEIFKDTRFQKIKKSYSKHQYEPGFNELLTDLVKKILENDQVAAKDSVKISITKPQPVQPADTPPKTDEASPSREKPPVSPEEKKSWFGGLKFEIDVFSIFFTLAIGIILLIGKGKKRSEEVPERFRNYVQDKLSKFNFDFATRQATERIDRDLAELRRTVEQQSRQLRDPALNAVPVLVPEPKAFNQDPIPETGRHEAPVEIIYLPTPGLDRSFDHSFASPVYREGTSIYKVTRKPGNRASFQIDEHETAIRLALQYAELRIEPCCIPLNAYNASSRRIELVRPGELELRENRWVILSKMEIRYEN